MSSSSPKHVGLLAAAAEEVEPLFCAEDDVDGPTPQAAGPSGWSSAAATAATVNLTEGEFESRAADDEGELGSGGENLLAQFNKARQFLISTHRFAPCARWQQRRRLSPPRAPPHLSGGSGPTATGV